MRVRFDTLGCRVNQGESDSLAAEFAQAGYEVVGPSDAAEVVVVNTCTVTGRADTKSLQATRRAQRSGDPSAPALTVATGCAVSVANRNWEALEGVLRVPNDQKTALLDVVEAWRRGELGNLPSPSDRFASTVGSRQAHTRGLIKIQDGCDNGCSFCIIPRVRGRGTSRDPGAIVDNAQALLDQGSRELVLTGINMTRYEYGSEDLVSVIRRILDLAGDYRLRLASVEPYHLGEDFARLFSHPRMAPSLHLCLQSGSDTVLQAMRRQYLTDDYGRLVDLLRKYRPDLALGTDLMVGFPGETESRHRESLAFAEAMNFANIHVFTYSPRQGTVAARMVLPVPAAEKEARRREAQELSDRAWERWAANMVGREDLLLVETLDHDKDDARLALAQGTGAHGLPVRLALPARAETPWPREDVRHPGPWWNRVLEVRIKEADAKTRCLVAEPLTR